MLCCRFGSQIGPTTHTFSQGDPKAIKPVGNTHFKPILAGHENGVPLHETTGVEGGGKEAGRPLALEFGEPLAEVAHRPSWTSLGVQASVRTLCSSLSSGSSPRPGRPRLALRRLDLGWRRQTLTSSGREFARRCSAGAALRAATVTLLLPSAVVAYDPAGCAVFGRGYRWAGRAIWSRDLDCVDRRLARSMGHRDGRFSVA